MFIFLDLDTFRVINRFSVFLKDTCLDIDIWYSSAVIWPASVRVFPVSLCFKLFGKLMNLPRVWRIYLFTFFCILSKCIKTVPARVTYIGILGDPQVHMNAQHIMAENFLVECSVPGIFDNSYNLLFFNVTLIFHIYTHSYANT